LLKIQQIYSKSITQTLPYPGKTSLSMGFAECEPALRRQLTAKPAGVAPFSIRRASSYRLIVAIFEEFSHVPPLGDVCGHGCQRWRSWHSDLRDQGSPTLSLSSKRPEVR
jgi:hypothetical protein